MWDVVREVHRVGSIPIRMSACGFEGLFVNVLELEGVSYKDIKAVIKWCKENYAACRAAEIFSRLNYRYDSQFLKLEDLLLIARSFLGDEIASKALEAIREIEYPTPQPPQKSESPQRRKVAGHVYLISGENCHYKIGKTKNLKNRTKLLGTQLPFKTHLVCAIPSDDISKLEDSLHQQFSHCRINGEWFRLTQEEVEEIKRMAGEVIR